MAFTDSLYRLSRSSFTAAWAQSQLHLAQFKLRYCSMGPALWEDQHPFTSSVVC